MSNEGKTRQTHLSLTPHRRPESRFAIDPARSWRSVANAEAVADAFYAHVVRRYAERFERLHAASTTRTGAIQSSVPCTMKVGGSSAEASERPV